MRDDACKCSPGRTCSPCAADTTAEKLNLTRPDTCACGEDIIRCIECSNDSCRNFTCADGPAPCDHQLDERAADDAAERASEDLLEARS